MNPELAKKLKELPEGRALQVFLTSEAAKLNTLEDINATDPDEIALETKARQKAYKTVKEMLSTLFDDSQFGILQEKDDSISTEMLQEQRSPQSQEN